MSTPRTIALAAALVATGLCTCGCLVSSSSRTYQSGTYVGPGTLAQIEPGKTDQEFILATLGPPASKSTLNDGVELWKWEYKSRRSSSGAVFLLFNSANHQETKVTTHVVFREGVVERVWQDG